MTETFGLSNLIGSNPKATLLQLAYCLLLYNLLQVIKAFVADDGNVAATVVSTYYLFNNIRREMTAWAYHTDGDWPRCPRSTAAMKLRLEQLTRGCWNPKRYRKASDRKPRPQPPPKKPLPGGHTSVQRLLEGRVK